MKSIHLHIDRIVVEGLPEATQRHFISALEERLREFAASGIANEFSGRARKRIESLNAGQLQPGATPAQAAMQVVQTIRNNISPKQKSQFGGWKNFGRGEVKNNV
jgi:hypothetical protein